MTPRVGSSCPQLHPLLVAVKRGWEKTIINRGVKQDWLATRCEVDKSRISRWKNPEVPDFPHPAEMALFIEALQEWPGVEHQEPLEEFARYFGCQVSACAPNPADTDKLPVLAGQLAVLSADAVQEMVAEPRHDITPALRGLHGLVESLLARWSGR